MLTSADSVSYASSLLRSGRTVAFPTETVYGLGADATNESAVKRIFEIKGRPSTNPLIVHIASIDWLSRITCALSPRQNELVKKLSHFWPGPLSLVLPAHPDLPRAVTAGRDSVGVRIPAHPLALDLIRKTDRPIAAPSANPSNYVSPTTALHVQESLGDKVDMILDGGPCSVGLESTILSLLTDPPELLRAGGLSIEEIERCIGPVKVPNIVHDAASEGALSPGLSKLHYSPKTRLVFAGALLQKDYPEKCARVFFSPLDTTRENYPFERIIELSATGDLNEVAQKLFATLRELDRCGLDLIVIDACEPVGIGRAIMDRLSRASVK